ncbi:hypothetical protein ABPG72_008153 [Tetrahymena utriculariae]
MSLLRFQVQKNMTEKEYQKIQEMKDILIGQIKSYKNENKQISVIENFDYGKTYFIDLIRLQNKQENLLFDNNISQYLNSFKTYQTRDELDAIKQKLLSIIQSELKKCSQQSIINPFNSVIEWLELKQFSFQEIQVFLLNCIPCHQEDIKKIEQSMSSLSSEQMIKLYSKIRQQLKIINQITDISRLNADNLYQQIIRYKRVSQEECFKSSEKLAKYISDAPKIEMILQFIDKIKFELGFQMLPKLDDFKLEDLKTILNYLEIQYSTTAEESNFDQVTHFQNEIKKIITIFKTIRSQQQLQAFELKNIFQKIPSSLGEEKDQAALMECLTQRTQNIIKTMLSKDQANGQNNKEQTEDNIAFVLNDEQINQLSINISRILINYQNNYLDKYAKQYQERTNSFESQLWSHFKKFDVLFFENQNYMDKIDNIAKIKLDLSETNIDTEEIKMLTTQFEKCQNIIELDAQFECNTIGDEGVKFLAQSLEKCQKIQVFKLDLGDNKISDSGAQYSSEFLQKNKNLFFLNLNLSFNQIGKNGAKSIGSGIGQCHRLTQLTLNLGYNQIGAEGAIQIAKSLEKLERLSQLSLNFRQNVMAFDDSQNICFEKCNDSTDQNLHFDEVFQAIDINSEKIEKQLDHDEENIENAKLLQKQLCDESQMEDDS